MQAIAGEGDDEDDGDGDGDNDEDGDGDDDSMMQTTAGEGMAYMTLRRPSIFVFNTRRMCWKSGEMTSDIVSGDLTAPNSPTTTARGDSGFALRSSLQSL